MLDLTPIKARLDNAKTSESTAVQDIRALVAEVERLRSGLQEIRAIVEVPAPLLRASAIRARVGRVVVGLLK